MPWNRKKCDEDSGRSFIFGFRGGDLILIQLYENPNMDAVMVNCVVPDSGSFEVPAALVAALDSHPINIQVSRSNIAEVDIAGETFHFRVTSVVHTHEDISPFCD